MAGARSGQRNWVDPKWQNGVSAIKGAEGLKIITSVPFNNQRSQKVCSSHRIDNYLDRWRASFTKGPTKGRGPQRGQSPFPLRRSNYGKGLWPLCRAPLPPLPGRYRKRKRLPEEPHKGDLDNLLIFLNRIQTERLRRFLPGRKRYNDIPLIGSMLVSNCICYPKIPKHDACRQLCTLHFASNCTCRVSSIICGAVVSQSVIRTTNHDVCCRDTRRPCPPFVFEITLSGSAIRKAYCQRYM